MVARILIIRHETEPPDLSHHAINQLIGEWCNQGHDVQLAYGTTNLPDADIAVLHVDLSVVPRAYAEAARLYPRVVNGSALDIRKRLVSRNLITRDDNWDGPVIVKANLNFAGWPEWQMRRRAIAMGKAAPAFPRPRSPRIFGNPGLVPEEVWGKRHIVVERFLPERDARGFAIRHWIFFGDRERCKRCLSPDPIIKGTNIIDVEDAPVPEFLRTERGRLGLDYGKFDFVVRQGRPILLDAN